MSPVKAKSQTSLMHANSVMAYLMIVPTLLLFIMFCIYPIFHILIMSFYEADGMTVKKWTGLYNYIRLMSDATWWKSVWNTVEFGILLPVVQVPIALILAVILNGKIRGKNFYRTMIFLPSITSTAITGIIFYFMFSSYNGIINAIFMKINLIQKPIEWLGKAGSSKAVIIIFGAWSHIGYYMVLLLAGLQKIPQEVYESATVDGASSFQTLVKITIPMLGSMFRTIIMLAILSAMKMFDTVKVLTGGGPAQKTMVMPMYIYQYYFEPSTGKLQQGYASALAIVGLIITAAVGVGYMYFSKKAAKNEEGGLL